MQRRPIRAITFDLDDTLWPIAAVIERAERTMYRWLGRHCPRVVERYTIEDFRRMRIELDRQRPELRHDFGLMRRQVLHQALIPLGGGESIVEQAYQVFFAARNQVELFADARPALEQLQDRYRLAGLSNGNACLETIGLAELLPVAIRAGEVGVLKPHAKMFLAASKRLGAPLDQILHVGDHLQHDVMGALGAGMQAVWLNRAGAPGPPAGIVAINTLEQLPQLVESML